MGNITHVRTCDPVVALTFDDGPHPEYTPRLLDVLQSYKAHATFFMIGKSAQRHPELVRNVAKNGHTIGNHSWDHPSFPLLTRGERLTQIRACEKAIAPYGQKLFRPPYGHQNIASRLDAFFLGYQVVTWNVVAVDWLDHDADWLLDKVLNEIHPGSIIILHDALNTAFEEPFARRESTIDAVGMLLERLNKDFQFLTIPELFRYGRPQRRIWRWEPDSDLMNKLKAVDI